MSMGTVVKYLSKVRERFWLASGCSPAGASDEFGMTWDGTDNQTQLDGQCVELTMFAGGPAAKVALDIVRTRGVDALHDFYAKRIEALYPNYRKNRLAKPRFIGWTDDRWGAGYSSPAPGEVTRIGPFLAAPFHRRMHFAGEHVCLPFFGYMEGALQSGLMSALAVMRQEALI
jgi:monoamine oxidase